MHMHARILCVQAFILKTCMCHKIGRVDSQVSLSTSIRANGMTSRLVGKPTAKPIAHPLTNLCRNPAVQPVIIDVIVKVIVEFIASVISIAINNMAYFLSNFIILNQSLVASLP